jgi:AAA domain/UvrD-like helicase C-terminal domain
MATLALAREFLSGYSKLDYAVQKRVQELSEKCRALSVAELYKAKGIHLETHAQQKDPRARTIRLGDNHRGIVLMPDEAEKIVLVNVLKHQDADHWMLHNEFKVNAATGALEIVNAGAIAAHAESVAQAVEAAQPAERLLFDHRVNKEFAQVGVDETLLPVLRILQTEEQLEALMLSLPQGQAEALILLTGDESVDAIYGQVAGSITPEELDTEDLAAAITAPASKAHFHVVTDEDDLAEMLARPLAQWRTYLHPSQRDIAYRPSFGGPVRVTGGAGTGKTVVAMHRAKALADKVGPSANGKPILFTTFTRNLAQAIERDLRLLGGSDLLDQVDVLNVDRLATRVVKDAEGSNIQIIEPEPLRDLWETKILELGLDHLSPTFTIGEWEQVVLAQGLDSRDDYFHASRAGRGVRLDRRARADVWKVIEAATREMESTNQQTYLQVAAKAAGYLQQEQVKPYRHVIVDEAQDLHQAQWRLLRAGVREEPDDMFIVGDAHQRIYGRRTSLSKVGVNIVGRSRKLRINYRTTRQILRWSLAVLGGGDFDDLDEGTDSQDIAGYHSFLDGPDPTYAGFTTRGAMVDGLVDQVRRWIDQGIDESAIGVAARTRATFSAVERLLHDAGIAAFTLGPDLNGRDGVAIGTMHRMKGLEFRCVAVIDASEAEVPNPYFLTPEAEDPVQHEADLRQERSVLYVASTRARDDLWVAWSGKPSPFLGRVLS